MAANSGLGEDVYAAHALYLDRLQLQKCDIYLFPVWLLYPACFVIAGVLKEWFVQPLLDPDFYSGITKEIDDKWKKTHSGRNVSETIKDNLVMYLGEPLNKLLRYYSRN